MTVEGIPPEYETVGVLPPPTVHATISMVLGYVNDGQLEQVVGLVVEPNPDNPHHSRGAIRRMLDTLQRAHYDCLPVAASFTYIIRVLDDPYPHFVLHLLHWEFVVDGVPLENAPSFSVELNSITHAGYIIRLMTDGVIEFLHPRTSGLVVEQTCPQELVDAILRVSAQLEAQNSAAT